MDATINAFSFLVALFLMAMGLYFLMRLKGFYVFHPMRIWRVLFSRRDSCGISPARALTVALAGTLGVGNIVGVASALLIGGPGSVFWMVLGAMVAMVLKYAEITLAMRHRHDVPGQAAGAHTYIHHAFSTRGLPRFGRRLSAVFLVLCLLNAVTMGGVLQINAAAGALAGAFSLPPILTGLVMAGVLLLLLRGSIVGRSCCKDTAKSSDTDRIMHRVSALTEWLVPLMTVAFLLGCLSILLLRRERLGEALRAIGTGTFSLRSVGGGMTGWALSRGIRAGIMRGLVSNEAGAGTAPMAHAAADSAFPAYQGVFGLAEVFVDTVLLCTVTALAILVSDTGSVLLSANGAASLSIDAVELARLSFVSVLGAPAGGFFALSILFFAFATVLCWAQYGSVCVSVLFGRHPWAQRVFLFVLALALPVGAVFAPAFAWMLADGVIGLMTLINLVVMLLLRREVTEETERAGLLR